MRANDRAVMLHRRADLIDKRKDVIVQIESLDGGKPRGQAAAAVQAAARERIDAELTARVGERCVAQLRKALGALCAMGRKQDEKNDH